MELTVETRVVSSQDNYSYAAFPSGVAAGTSFQHLYGQQWGSLSKFVGLDLVLLRDGVGR